MRLLGLPLALATLLLAQQPSRAALSRLDLAGVTAAPATGAAVPLALRFTDAHGATRSLGEALGGRPALLILADYRCTQLCGSILAIAAQALDATGLAPDRDFSLVVVGFNPDAVASDAAAMQDAELSLFPSLAAAARVLTGPPSEVTALERAIGFSAVRDEAAGRFAHPAEVYVLTPDGTVSRVLGGLALDPATLRLALVEAGQGRIGSLVDRLHLLCYGLDPLSNASGGLAQAMLRVGAGATLLGAGALVMVAVRRRRPVLRDR